MNVSSLWDFWSQQATSLCSCLHPQPSWAQITTPWAFLHVTAPTWPPFLSLLTDLSYKIPFRNHLLQAAFPDHPSPAGRRDPSGLLQFLLILFIKVLSSKEVIHSSIHLFVNHVLAFAAVQALG